MSAAVKSAGRANRRARAFEMRHPDDGSGASFAEIGKQLGVSASTARQWVKRQERDLFGDPALMYLALDTLIGGALLTRVPAWLTGYSAPQQLLVPAAEAQATVVARGADPLVAVPVPVYPNPDGSGVPLAQPLTPDADGRLPGYVAQPAALDLYVTGPRLEARLMRIGFDEFLASVASVNGKTGAVILSAADVGAVDRTSVDVNICDPAYGAKGDVLDGGLGTITGGALGQLSIVHEKRPAGFVAGDAGKTVVVWQVGTNGFPHTTTIASVAAGVATLTAPAAQAGAGVLVRWGTDSDAQIKLAVAAADGRPVLAPAGAYFYRDALTAPVIGAGSGATTLFRLPDRTINGTHYPTGNWHPAVCNPQALTPAYTPASAPDIDFAIEGVTIDLMVDPANAQGWNGLQGNGIDLYSLLRGHTRDVRVRNSPFSGVEIASNRSGSDHRDGVGNTGAAVDSEIPTVSGAYLKEPAPCQNLALEGRLEARNTGWQWANYYGQLSDQRAFATVLAGSTQLQISDGSQAAVIAGAQAMPAATINIVSTAGMPASGKLLIAGVTGVVSYTGKTGTTFTGCTGGAGVAADGAAVRSAGDLSHWFPGLRIGLGSHGVWGKETPSLTSFEAATVKAVDQATNTVTLDSATTFDHGVGTFAGPVAYWGDPGFGVCIRQPARGISADMIVSDLSGWGGFSMGQAQNYQFSPLSVRNVHVNKLRITRAGAGGAPAMKIGFVEDCTINGVSIGDRGGLLLSAAGLGSSVLVLRTSEGRRFYAGEPIKVGNPGSGSIESAVIASVVTFHADPGTSTGCHLVNGSPTVTNVTPNAWRVGEKIEGISVLGNTTIVSGALAGGGTTATPGDLITGGTVTMSNPAASGYTGPLHGGDTVFLSVPLAAAHAVGEDVFYDPKTAAGIAIQEVGSVSTFGVKIGSAEIVHQYDGVQETNKDGAYLNQRHSLLAVTARRNLRHGFYEEDSSNIMHANCVATENGDTGFKHNNATAQLANLQYVNCESYGNVVQDWGVIAGTYHAQGCLGLPDTGVLDQDFGDGLHTTFTFAVFTRKKYPMVQVVNTTSQEVEDVSITFTAPVQNASGLWSHSITIAGWAAAPALNAYHVTVS